MGFPARRRDRPSESQASPRAMYYDRNPTVIFKWWASNDVAPHALTDRWSYTVPTGKKAFLESVLLQVLRTATATTPLRPRSGISYQPYGQAMEFMFLAYLRANTLYDRDKVVVGWAGVMAVGDLIIGRTWDDSTGGTNDYLNYAKIMQFDA